MGSEGRRGELRGGEGGVGDERNRSIERRARVSERGGRREMKSTSRQNNRPVHGSDAGGC